MRSSLFHPLCLLLFLAVFSFSCSKEREPVDVRDELAGTYTYLNGSVTGFSGNSVIEISRHSTHSDRIQLQIQPGNVSFYAEDLKREAGGIHFRIPPQLIMLSGIPMLLEGNEVASLEQQLHQGVYTRATQELQLGLSLALMTPSGPGRSVSGLMVAERKP